MQKKKYLKCVKSHRLGMHLTSSGIPLHWIRFHNYTLLSERIVTSSIILSSKIFSCEKKQNISYSKTEVFFFKITGRLQSATTQLSENTAFLHTLWYRWLKWNKINRVFWILCIVFIITESSIRNGFSRYKDTKYLLQLYLIPSQIRFLSETMNNIFFRMKWGVTSIL